MQELISMNDLKLEVSLYFLEVLIASLALLVAQINESLYAYFQSTIYQPVHPKDY